MKTNKTTTNIFFPYAFRFDAYQDYDKGILQKRTERILFEYLLGMGAYYLRYKRKDSFFHSYKTIKRRTGVAASVARSIVESFGGHDSESNAQILNILTTGTTQINHAPTTTFSLNYRAILKSLSQIYGNSTELNLDQKARINERRKALIALIKLAQQQEE